MKAQESGAGNAIGLVHDTRRHVTWFLRRQSIEGQKHCKTFDALLLMGKNTEFQKSLPWKGPWLIKHITREHNQGVPLVPKTFHARFAVSVDS